MKKIAALLLAGLSLAISGAGCADASNRLLRIAHAIPATIPPPTVPFLTAGTGWGGVPTVCTDVVSPCQQGNPASYGYGDNATANIDEPSYLTFNSVTQIGVKAYHQASDEEYAAGIQSNISYVACSVDGGPWAQSNAPSTNSTTGVSNEYNFNIDPSQYADAAHEMRCIAVPSTGVPFIMQGTPLPPSTTQFTQSVFFRTNFNGGLSHTVMNVGGTTGNDATCSIGGTLCQTIQKATDLISAAQGDMSGAKVCIVEAGNYTLGSAAPTSRAAVNGFFEVGACNGLTRNDVTITSVGPSGIRVSKVRLKEIGLKVGVTSATNGNTTTPYLLLDGVKFVGVSPGVSTAVPYFGATIWKGGVWCTDVDITSASNGCTGAIIARKTTLHQIGADSYQNSEMVIDGYVEDAGDYEYGTGNIFSGDTCVHNLSNVGAFVIGGQINVTNSSAHGINNALITAIGTCDGPNSATISKAATPVAGFPNPVTLDAGFHSDIFQVFPGVKNMIFDNVDANHNNRSQGLFANGSPTIDSVFANVKVNNVEGGGAFTINFINQVSNVLFLNVQSIQTIATNKNAWSLTPAPGFTGFHVMVQGGFCSAAFSPHNPGGAVQYRSAVGC